MRSGRAGPNFSLPKSRQKPPKDVPSFGNLPDREPCNGGSCRCAPRRTVLAVALAMRGILARDFFSALAMNSGAAGFIAEFYLLANLHRDSRRSEARVAFARLRLRPKAREESKGGKVLWRFLHTF